jgi:hypothetical protein
MLAYFRSVADDLKPVAEVTFRHLGGPLVLCDSSDTPRNWMGEHFEFSLPAGEYRVTAIRAAEDEVSFIAHEWQFVRLRR